MNATVRLHWEFLKYTKIVQFEVLFQISSSTEKLALFFPFWEHCGVWLVFQTQKRVHIDPGHNLAAPHLSLATPTNSFLNSKNAKVHYTVVDNEENPPSSLFEKNVWRNIVLSFFGVAT